jgi:LacI family repressor for deo operon, udp, cdd, tsx, nupC, and nupG
MATIRDVSKEAGVSIATVSRALSAPEKVAKASLKKVQDAIDKLHYKPNMMSQKFRNKTADCIVVLVPDISNLFFTAVIRGIETIAQKNGSNVLLGDTRDSSSREKYFIHLVETRQADGIIQLRPYTSDSALPMNNVLAVNASGCENTPYPTVRIDNAGAAKDVTKYLLSLGHTRIGVISGLKENPHTIDRIKGYQGALQEAGIAFEQALIAEGDFSMWSGLNATEHFMQMAQLPTAIFCMNDEMAIGAIKGFRRKGLTLPQDMSITGFDNLEISRYCEPSLTTVSQPAEKVGEKSAELLFKLISGERPTQAEYILPVEFVIRESTSTPRK